MCRRSGDWLVEALAGALNMSRTSTACWPRRNAEALIPDCARHGLRYTAFSPLAGGFLSGKYRLGEEPPSGSRLAQAPEACAGYLSEESFAAIEQLRRSADARGGTMASAALRFVLDTPGVDGLIVAPRRVEHFASLGFAPQ